MSTTRFPFTSYPNNSWFKVAFARDVAAGAEVTVHYFGRDLTIARDEQGTIHIRDAEREWPATERNRVLYGFYSREHAPPRFDVPLLPEATSAEWTDYHELHWRVRTHIQEIAENAVDLAHFAVLHDYDEVPTADWVETVGNRLVVEVRSRRKILWRERETDLRLEYNGMGCVVARVRSQDVHVTAHLLPTPIDEEHVHLNVNVMFKRTGSALKDWLIRTFTFRDVALELDRDILVWERKSFLVAPVLCAADGPIHQVRKWARTFY